MLSAAGDKIFHTFRESCSGRTPNTDEDASSAPAQNADRQDKTTERPVVSNQTDLVRAAERKTLPKQRNAFFESLCGLRLVVCVLRVVSRYGPSEWCPRGFRAFVFVECKCASSSSLQFSCPIYSSAICAFLTSFPIFAILCRGARCLRMPGKTCCFSQMEKRRGGSGRILGTDWVVLLVLDQCVCE